MTNTSITTSGGELPLFAAGDPSAARGAVVVIQEAFGVTAHIERCCERLAEADFLAVAPALFHRTTTDSFAYDDFEHAMPNMAALSAEGIEADLAAVARHLDAVGFERSRRGIVGFCMGGLVAFVGATLGEFGAAVTFYGGGVTTGRFGYPPLVELADHVATPWLGLYGDLDKGIPPHDVELLRDAVASAPAPTEIVRYADADHGFNCEDRPGVFNPDAASDAWARMLAFFDQHLA